MFGLIKAVLGKTVTPTEYTEEDWALYAQSDPENIYYDGEWMSTRCYEEIRLNEARSRRGKGRGLSVKEKSQPTTVTNNVTNNNINTVNNNVYINNNSDIISPNQNKVLSSCKRLLI